MNATIVHVTIIPIFIITITFWVSSCIWVRELWVTVCDFFSSFILVYFLSAWFPSLVVFSATVSSKFVSPSLPCSVLFLSVRLRLWQRDADTANQRTIDHSWCPAMQWWSCSALHPPPCTSLHSCTGMWSNKLPTPLLLLLLPATTTTISTTAITSPALPPSQPKPLFPK